MVFGKTEKTADAPKGWPGWNLCMSILELPQAWPALVAGPGLTTLPLFLDKA